MGREKGRCPIDKSLFVKCPDGYVYACMEDGNNDYVILEGDGSFDGGWLKIYEGPTLELEVRVEEKDYEEAEEWEETAEHVVIHDRIVLELEREDKGQQEETREEEIESEADKDDGEDLDMMDEEEDEEIEEKENTEDRTKKEHEQNVDLNESTKDMNKNTEEENINTMEEDI